MPWTQGIWRLTWKPVTLSIACIEHEGVNENLAKKQKNWVCLRENLLAIAVQENGMVFPHIFKLQRAFRRVTVKMTCCLLDFFLSSLNARYFIFAHVWFSSQKDKSNWFYNMPSAVWPARAYFFYYCICYSRKKVPLSRNSREILRLRAIVSKLFLITHLYQ